MKSKTHPAFDAIIFDIDNVLVDTRMSYLEAIRWTIEIYLTSGTIPLFSPNAKHGSPTVLTSQDVDDFKLLGGFNDDWDCCYGILVYLLSFPVKKRTLGTLKEAINIRRFVQSVKHRPLGVSGIVKMFGRPSSVIIERVARIFQEIYLGKDLFEPAESKKSAYWKKRGLIHKEKLIFKKPILSHLKEMGIQLAIATGRPRFEALHVLKRFDILELFDCITPIDEVKKAERLLKQSLRKPHPYSILETAKKLGGHKRFIYLGDLPDDVIAANRAKETLSIVSGVFLSLAKNPKEALAEIRKAHPDFIIQKPRDLIALVEKG